MPIEIKELHIKAVVTTGSRHQQANFMKPEDMVKLKKELTKTITDNVLKILQLKNDR